MKGNYTESEVPYIATVVAYYEGGETREIQIRDTKRENKMLSVVAIYGPDYFLHNNSHVPTTTTTTTTTTTSTTIKTTSTTQDVTPIVSPAILVNRIGNEDDHNNELRDQEHIHDKQEASTVGNKAEESKNKDEASSISAISLLTVLLMVMMIHKIT